MAAYERFAAWRECHALALEVYRATRAFPREELYGLTSQTRRAAFSAAANIVEGSAKHGAREYRRFSRHRHRVRWRNSGTRFGSQENSRCCRALIGRGWRTCEGARGF